MASVFVLITFAAKKEPKPSSPSNEAEDKSLSSELTSEEESIAKADTAQDEPDDSDNGATKLAPANSSSGSESESETQSNKTETESEHGDAKTDSSASTKVDEVHCTDSARSANENKSSKSGEIQNNTELKIVRTAEGDVKVDNNTDTLIPLNDDGGNNNKQVTFLLGDSTDEGKHTEKEVADRQENKVEISEKDTLTTEKELHPDYDRTASVDDYGGTVKLTAETISEVLSMHKVEDLFWRTSEDGMLRQVTFMIDYGTNCEKILEQLTKLGVGSVNNSSLSMFPATYYCKADDDEEESLSSAMESTKEENEGSMEEFRKSIKSRLLVAEVVESVKGNSRLTFDYIVLIVLASMIACMGLVENSSVILVASMLVSPLMGPIMAGTFGIVIKNSELKRMGIKNELIGLTLCVACGILCGIVFGLCVAIPGNHWGSSTEWPTIEMKSRGLSRSLWVGVLIAIPSGAGVAFSILGGNAGSLVGVAISASLLPPAVNAGVLWAISLISAISPPAIIFNGTVIGEPNMPCPPFRNNDYVPVYSCSMAKETILLGLISLLLTILNILCIFFMSIVVLKIKEVAPHTATSAAAQSFWKKDIKVARKSYSTVKGPYGATLKKQFLEEYSKYSGKKEVPNDAAYQVKTMVETMTKNPEVTDIRSRLCNPTGLKFNWSSENVSPTVGFPGMYQTVRNRHRPDSIVYKTIHSYSGDTKVTHKVLRRSSDNQVSQISETEDSTKKNRKNLKVTIPQLKMRKSSDLNKSRSFVITTVPEDTDDGEVTTPDGGAAMPAAERENLLQPQPV
ncbi:uncharacterized protein LOC135481265 [Liolophura sinensis]|uniref:uncharacterized protein LOC135481265 n=1 Tax=Liolophura sinensis TaxID=3198878 RepID=UPI0031591130